MNNSFGRVSRAVSLKNCYISILVCSAAVFAVCMAISPPALKTGGAARFLLIYALNYLPVLCVMLILFSLFGNLAAAVYIPGAFFVLMAFANRYLLALRREPVRWQDVFLVDELAGISKSFGLAAILGVLAAFAAALALFIVLVIKIKNESVRRLGWKRFAVPLISLAALALECGAPAPAAASLPDAGRERGFVLYFCQSAFAGPKKPMINSIPDNLKDDGKLHIPSGAEKPNVIMILGESFSDIALSDALKPWNAAACLTNFEQAAGEGTSGHIVVPGFGGGTSDTEFDVLTGMNTRDFRFAPFTLRLVSRPTPSLASLLNSAGYFSEALHPGDPAFYSRDTAYPNMGFNRFLSLKDFGDIPFKGLYANESDTIGKVISEFEANTGDPSRPFFEFCVTIQNHGPYNNKYAEVTNFLPGPVPFGVGADPSGASLGLSKSSYNALSNYLYGLRDADIALGRLLDYLRASAKPAVLVYFGDHMPPMMPDVYSALLPGDTGVSSADELKRCRLPFLIWANAAAKQAVTLPKNPAGPISSFYLGGLLLQTLGYSNTFFDYLNDMREQYPVLMDNNLFDKSGGSINCADSDAYKLYYKMEYERIISNTR